jgi:hypothetical protein
MQPDMSLNVVSVILQITDNIMNMYYFSFVRSSTKHDKKATRRKMKMVDQESEK